MFTIFKDPTLPSYINRITYPKSTLASLSTSTLLHHRPELSYIHIILQQLCTQLNHAEQALARRNNFSGQLKRVLRCRDVLDCHLNGMVTRLNDMEMNLRAGLVERERIGGGGEGEKRVWIPTKTEGKSVLKESVGLREGVQEASEGESEDVFQDAVEGLELGR